MKIGAEEVVHVAHLARLKLSESEIELFTGQLNDILEYVDRLNELDTENVEPTAHVLSLQNVWREDCVEESLPREKILANAPSKEQGFFKVPKII